MYDIMLVVLPLFIAALGAYMFLCPVKSTKEENRDKPEEVAKIKRSGGILVIVGVVVAIIQIIL